VLFVLPALDLSFLLLFLRACCVHLNWLSWKKHELGFVYTFHQPGKGSERENEEEEALKYICIECFLCAWHCGGIAVMNKGRSLRKGEEMKGQIVMDYMLKKKCAQSTEGTKDNLFYGSIEDKHQEKPQGGDRFGPGGTEQ
jgi:hypothetical protein